MCTQEGASLFYPENSDEASAVISKWKLFSPDSAWMHVGISDIITEGDFKTIDGKSTYIHCMPIPNKLGQEDGLSCHITGNAGGDRSVGAVQFNIILW